MWLEEDSQVCKIPSATVRILDFTARTPVRSEGFQTEERLIKMYSFQTAAHFPSGFSTISNIPPTPSWGCPPRCPKPCHSESSPLSGSILSSPPQTYFPTGSIRLWSLIRENRGQGTPMPMALTLLALVLGSQISRGTRQIRQRGGRMVQKMAIRLPAV